MVPKLLEVTGLGNRKELANWIRTEPVAFVRALGGLGVEIPAGWAYEEYLRAFKKSCEATIGLTRSHRSFD